MFDRVMTFTRKFKTNNILTRVYLREIVWLRDVVCVSERKKTLSRERRISVGILKKKNELCAASARLIKR